MKIKWIPYIIILIVIFPLVTSAQCLSSVNPVGGTNNLLVLEKNSFRFISFYKFGQSKRYYKGSNPSDFLYINDANYNYLSAIIGYGFNSKFTMEMEAGYFLNKTYNYVHSQNPHIGKGFSNIVILGKHSIYSDHTKRFYITGAAGPKIPFSREYQYVNNIELPVEVQPTIGAYGMVISTSFVKENSATGMRFFLTNRMEINAPNKKDYKLGSSLYNSFYVSKHLMAIKGDWTAIMQVRNEIRGTDRIGGDKKESSGSNLFYLAPQINYVLKEEWYISAMVDIPVYQYFNGTQLGASTGFTVILSKTFSL
jgi:hypothetical protein